MVVENPRGGKQPVSVPVKPTGMDARRLGNAVDPCRLKGRLFVLRFACGIAENMGRGSIKKSSLLSVRSHRFKEIDQREDMDLKAPSEQFAFFLKRQVLGGVMERGKIIDLVRYEGSDQIGHGLTIANVQRKMPVRRLI